jgi:hypothetical protein
MVRGTAIVLGIGLVILWLVGLNEGAALWLTWLNGVAALVAFTIGAAANDESASALSVAGGPIGLSLGLYVLWVVGLATHAETWLCWWTFVFACAFLAIGVFSTTTMARRPTTTTTPRAI